MATLFELTQEFLNCTELDNGDIVNTETGEVLTYEQLDALAMARDQKIEAVACQIKNLLAEEAAIKEEMGRMMERRKRAERRTEWLRGYLAANLNGQKFASPKVEVSFRNSPPKVVFTDEQAFMAWAVTYAPDLLNIKPPEPNKTEIKAAIKEGQLIPGAELVREMGMQIK